MKTNVKGIERVVRIAVGAYLVGPLVINYAVPAAIDFGMIDEVIGVVLLGTGVLGSCPIKSVLGIGSKKASARPTAARKPAKRKPARKAAAKKPAAKKPATKRKAAPKRRRAAR